MIMSINNSEKSPESSRESGRYTCHFDKSLFEEVSSFIHPHLKDESVAAGIHGVKGAMSASLERGARYMDSLEAHSLPNIGMVDFIHRKVLLSLLRTNMDEGDVRVWVPCCGWGADAYLTAAIFRQESESRGWVVFATDFDRSMVRMACIGRIPASIAEGYRSTPLNGYFKALDSERVKLDEGLRAGVCFAPHRLFHDPPYMKINFLMLHRISAMLSEKGRREMGYRLKVSLSKTGMVLLSSEDETWLEDYDFKRSKHHPLIWTGRDRDTASPAIRQTKKRRSMRDSLHPSMIKWGVHTKKRAPALAISDKNHLGEGTVHETGREYERLLEQVGFSFLLLNQDMTVRKFSQAVTRLIQLTEKDVGKPLESLRSEWMDLRQMAKQVCAVWEKEQPIETEVRLGGQFYLQRIVVAARENGQKQGVLLIFSDITERMAKQTLVGESEKKFHAVFDQTLQFICLLNPEGVVLEINQVALDILGVKRQEILGDKFWEALCWENSPEIAGRLKKGIQDAGSGEGVRFEVNIPQKEEAYLTFDFSIRPIRDERGNIVFILPEGRDITERKVAEQSLLQGKLLAESTNRMKNEFIAMMSHEIRTPLNGMLGSARLLQSTLLNGEQADFVRAIDESGTRLLRLLNDLLDISKMESGKLVLYRTHFSVWAVIDECCAVFRKNCLSRGLQLNHQLAKDVPPILIGDEARFRQILFNLIGNAVKFTAKGGVNVRVVREVDPAEENTCRLTISVQDTGIGIARELQNSIFQAFTQIDSSSRRKYAGAGLGLAICSRLTDLMQGRIWLESAPGEGATFFVNLPFQTGESDGIPPQKMS